MIEKEGKGETYGLLKHKHKRKHKQSQCNAMVAKYDDEDESKYI